MQIIKNSALIIASTCLLASHFALAGPQMSDSSVNTIDGSVSGNNSSNVTVNLNALSSVLNWDNFNTTQSDRVTFNLLGGGQVLNLINDSNRTFFNGTLMANNGSVFLINPHGIEFGTSSIIAVPNGSFIASSLTISADDFNNKNYQFSAAANKGVVINSGTIFASHVGLIANSVVNQGQGIISAIASNGGDGSVSLVAGEAVTLSFDSAGLMQFEVTGAVTENLADPASNNNAIEHNSSGQISAAHILLSARTAASIFDKAINSTGRLEAVSIVNQNGTIRLRSEGALAGEDINIDLDITTNKESEKIIVSIPTPPAPTPEPDNGDNPPVDSGDGETPSSEPSTSLAVANLNTLNANSNNPGNDNNVAASTSTSLGLYSVEQSGIRLPADQQDEF